MGVWWSSSSPSAIDAQSKRAVYVAKFVPSFRALEVTWFKMKPGRTPLQLYPHMHTAHAYFLWREEDRRGHNDRQRGANVDIVDIRRHDAILQLS